MRPPVNAESPAQSANGALSVAPSPVTNGIRGPSRASSASRMSRPRRADGAPPRRRTASSSRLKKCARTPVVRQARHEQVVAARHVEVGGRRDLRAGSRSSCRSPPPSASPRRCTASRRCRARCRSCDCRRTCDSTAASRTGSAAARRGAAARCSIISWFEQSIRCVLMTPFGMPVEPDVKRIFATVSGPTRACASSTALVGSRSFQLAREQSFSARRDVVVDVTIGVSGPATLVSARS